jgi:hypothetical protein
MVDTLGLGSSPSFSKTRIKSLINQKRTNEKRSNIIVLQYDILYNIKKS